MICGKFKKIESCLPPSRLSAKIGALAILQMCEMLCDIVALRKRYKNLVFVYSSFKEIFKHWAPKEAIRMDNSCECEKMNYIF